MTPKNMEMGKAGRARRTMPRMRLVIQRPYIGGREISKLMDRIYLYSHDTVQGYPTNQDTVSDIVPYLFE